MSGTRILIIAHPGANLDSLYAVLPALIDGVVLFHSSQDIEAREALIEHHPHLVLVDSEIGYQDARLIFELLTTQFPEVRIIILSDAAHWQRWRTICGPHQVLLKGFSTRRLKATLSKALPGSPAAEA
jgi:DNA-binding NarL/FixJ family response regulator